MPEETSSTSSLPRRVGKYRLLRVLGEGGIARTFLAVDRESGQQLAVKELQLVKARESKQIELFERECATLQELEHSQIPEFIDTVVERHDETLSLFLVQEFIDGLSLQQQLDVGRRFTPPETVAIMRSCMVPLQYLHTRKPPLYHRDIKPSNIILRPDGTCALIDFGAVRQALADPLTRGSSVVGTFGYMAPEQFQAKAFPATDLYGLGATAFQLLTGIEPARLELHRLKPDIHPYLRGSDPHLAAILDLLLEPAVEDRYGTVDSLLRALDRWEHAHGTPVELPDPSSDAASALIEELERQTAARLSGSRPAVSGSRPSVSGSGPSVSGSQPSVSGRPSEGTPIGTPAVVIEEEGQPQAARDRKDSTDDGSKTDLAIDSLMEALETTYAEPTPPRDPRESTEPPWFSRNTGGQDLKAVAAALAELSSSVTDTKQVATIDRPRQRLEQVTAPGRSVEEEPADPFSESSDKTVDFSIPGVGSGPSKAAAQESERLQQPTADLPSIPAALIEDHEGDEEDQAEDALDSAGVGVVSDSSLDLRLPDSVLRSDAVTTTIQSSITQSLAVLERMRADSTGDHENVVDAEAEAEEHRGDTDSVPVVKFDSGPIDMAKSLATTVHSGEIDILSLLEEDDDEEIDPLDQSLVTDNDLESALKDIQRLEDDDERTTGAEPTGEIRQVRPSDDQPTLEVQSIASPEALRAFEDGDATALAAELDAAAADDEGEERRSFSLSQLVPNPQTHDVDEERDAKTPVITDEQFNPDNLPRTPGTAETGEQSAPSANSWADDAATPVHLDSPVDPTASTQEVHNDRDPDDYRPRTAPLRPMEAFEHLPNEPKLRPREQTSPGIISARHSDPTVPGISEDPLYTQQSYARTDALRPISSDFRAADTAPLEPLGDPPDETDAFGDTVVRDAAASAEVGARAAGPHTAPMPSLGAGPHTAPIPAVVVTGEHPPSDEAQPPEPSEDAEDSSAEPEADPADHAAAAEEADESADGQDDPEPSDDAPSSNVDAHGPPTDRLEPIPFLPDTQDPVGFREPAYADDEPAVRPDADPPSPSVVVGNSVEPDSVEREEPPPAKKRQRLAAGSALSKLDIQVEPRGVSESFIPGGQGAREMSPLLLLVGAGLIAYGFLGGMEYNASAVLIGGTVVALYGALLLLVPRRSEAARGPGPRDGVVASEVRIRRLVKRTATMSRTEWLVHYEFRTEDDLFFTGVTRLPNADVAKRLVRRPDDITVRYRTANPDVSQLTVSARKR